MSVNLAAVEALFPPTMPNQSAAGVAQAPTIRGPCPYDAFERGRFSPLFVGVIETVRSDTKWGAVYRGDLTTYGGDHSSADLALCGEFKRLGLDALAIDTAFRTSGLYRAKWERDDYRTRTIAIATGRPDGATARSSGGLLAPENGRVPARLQAARACA